MFFISQLIVSTLYRTIYVILIPQYNFPKFYQFSGELVGCMGGIYFSLYTFDWFDKTPNNWVIATLCFLIHFYSTFRADEKFHPYAQLMGGGIGIGLASGFFV